MRLKRARVVAAVIALVLAIILIGTVAAKVASSFAIQQGMIMNLRMSDSCDGPDMILFPAGTETVYVVFDYSDMQGEERRIAVTDGVTLYDASHSYTGSGTECITVTHTAGPIPPDTYCTQIYAGGLLPIKTLLWHVRPGGPGEIRNLHMSTSPDGPPMTEFPPGTQTVWAVFDYADMEGNEVGIDVFEGDYRFHESARVLLTGSGTKAISVTHQAITGFPIGQYRTHIVKDGFVDGIVNWSVAPGPANIAITADPTSMSVGGYTSTIRANVIDAYGNAVADGTPVVFTTDLGSLGSTTVTKTTTNGVAVATLTSGLIPGTATVRATVDSKFDTVTVNIVPGPPYNIGVTANPTYIPIGGATSSVTATVKDRYGNNVADGTSVEFYTTLGEVSPSSDTTIEGMAGTTLTSGIIKGTARVTAISGPAEGWVDVIFTVGPPFYVNVVANPTSIGLNGETSNIQATVKDIGGNNVADGTEVTFTTSLGTLGSDTVIKTTTSGVAEAILTSETTAGTAVITATADSHYHTTKVVFSPDPPHNVTVTADPMAIPANGVSTSAVQATVTDQYGNMVADGISCYFHTTLGTVWPSFDTTLSGVAETTLTSSETPGLAAVTATCEGIEGTIHVSFYYSYLFKAHLPLIRCDTVPTPTVCDGGFEARTFEPCWAEGGELARSVEEWLDVGEPTPTIEPAYAGRYSALLGDPSLGEGLPTQPGIPVGSAWIEQSIQVPSTGSPHLSFWYRIITYDVARDAVRQLWDIFALEINDELAFWDGNREPGTSQRRHDLGWRRGEVDLSPWRGQTITVHFANWNGYSREPGAELYNTWTYLDEVQLQP